MGQTDPFQNNACQTPLGGQRLVPIPTGARRVVLAWTLTCLSAFAPLATDMYLAAFQEMADDLGTKDGTIQLTLAFFWVGLATGQLFWGTVSDYLGRRVPMVAGCALFMGVSAWAASTRSPECLLVARFFMGLGGSAGVVVSRAVVRDLFEDRDAAKFYSLMMIVGGLAPIIAPFMGELLLRVGNWRLIFWVLVGFGALCASLVLALVQETLPPVQRARGRVSAMLAGYGEVLGNRDFWRFALVAGCGSGVLFTYISSSSNIFIKLYGVPKEYFGFLFATNSIGLFAGGRLNTWLLGRFSGEFLLRKATLAGVAAAAVLLGVTASGAGNLEGVGLPLFFGVLLLNLATLGVIFPNTAALAMQPFAKTAGRASALLGVFQFVIGAAGAGLTGVLPTDTPLAMTCLILAYAIVSCVLLRVLGKTK